MTRRLVSSLIVVIATVAVALAYDTGTASALGQAGASAQPSASGAKRFRATRPFVVDKQTGQRRMPTEVEIAELVENLTTLTARPADNVQEVARASGAGVAALVDPGFSGVVLARPNDDGSFETRCVFTFEEGAEFMGLVAENQ